MHQTHRSTSRAGSALMIALVMVGVLIGLGATSFIVINNKYRVVHQAASWEESLLTAEAGVDIALTEVRKQLWDPTHAWSGWTTADGTEATPGPTIGPVYRTSEALLRQGEGATRSQAYVSVDAPTFLQDATGEQWYRIRSRGVCEVPGGAIVAGAWQDVRLRKLDVVFDRSTAQRLTTPQAGRLIEAIAKPAGAFPVPVLSIDT